VSRKGPDRQAASRLGDLALIGLDDVFEAK